MNKQNGFTLLELLVVVVIISILTIMAVPMFGNNTIDCKNPDARPGYFMRAKIANVTGALGEINLKADMYDLRTGKSPTSLADLGIADKLDPWGNPYVFLSFEGIQGNGPKRKDHNLVPVNSYFDIYSMGPDGKTATPFTSTAGRDDIVIANNGQYVGIACKYYTK